LTRQYFQSLESAKAGEAFASASLLAKLSFNDQGLIPVVTQQVDTGKVLMLAWMNREAIDQTLTTGMMTYWSRSRQAFWIKGESSGNYQQLKEMRIDCDGDALLCLVDQRGPACHTGRSNCFYFSAVPGSDRICVIESAPEID